MEENKVTNSEVKMEARVNSQSNGQDMEGSLIEELQKWTKEKLIQQIIQMNRQLYNQDKYVHKLRDQIDEMQNYFSNKRMDYLFRVVEIASNYRASDYSCFTRKFVEECIAELQDSLSIPEQAKSEECKEK